MLKIENVKKDYESFSLSVSMHVERGRITGLIGRNGAGKSTTFKTALGLVRKEGGSVKVFDKDVERLENSDREKIGVVLGDAGFSSSLTVWDIRKIMKKLYPENVYDDAWFQEKCEEQGLPQKKKIKEFSTGMRAKLKVLLAMSHQASLLILDEPTPEKKDEILPQARRSQAPRLPKRAPICRRLKCRRAVSPAAKAARICTDTPPRVVLRR